MYKNCKSKLQFGQYENKNIRYEGIFIIAVTNFVLSCMYNKNKCNN